MVTGGSESTALDRHDEQELRIGGGGRLAMTWVEEGRDLRRITGAQLDRERLAQAFACAMDRAEDLS
jgi:hypothetical protein